MIFFYCPDCNEELEAEDSIKGMRMKCPACWKEIAVPEVGVKVPSGSKRGRAVEPIGGNFGLKLFAFTLVMALLGVGAFFGARHFMKEREKQQQPKCSACKGSGKQECKTCSGQKTFQCANQECHGTGKVIHGTTGQETPCPDCMGSGRRPCATCSGSGSYGCDRCQGSGTGP